MALLEYFRKLAHLFLFDIDPEQESLDAEKDNVIKMSKEAQAKNAKRMAEEEAELSSDSSEPEDRENNSWLYHKLIL